MNVSSIIPTMAFENLVADAQTVIIDEVIRSSHLFTMVLVSKDWKVCAETFTTNVIIPRMIQLAEYLKAKDDKYQDLGHRVIKKMSYWCDLSFEAFNEGKEKQIIPIKKIHDNYTEIGNLLPLFTDYCEYRSKIGTESSLSLEIFLPKILEKKAKFENQEITASRLLHEFGKIDLVGEFNSTMQMAQNQKSINPTFCTGSSSMSVWYVNCGKNNMIYALQIYIETIRSFNTFSEMYVDCCVEIKAPFWPTLN